MDLASTKSAPQRSGDGRPPRGHPDGRVGASTKSAPQRSGDRPPPLTSWPGWRLNEVRSPKERRHSDGPVPRHPARRASTKSAPQRSGDRDTDHSRAVSSRPQRSPLPKGAETAQAETTAATRWCLNEVRSPKERRPAGRPGAHLRAGASTKSAPQRSGDFILKSLRLTAPGGPQRSPLPKGAETVALAASCPVPSGLNEVRSPKERRRPSPGSGVPGRCSGLNEVRSPKERRRSRRCGCGTRRSRLNEVRSPKERRQPTRSAPRLASRLNVVRSPKERRLRPAHPSMWHGPPQRSPLPKGAETDRPAATIDATEASTKSAPQRSGDHCPSGAHHRVSAPQRSPLPKGAETSAGHLLAGL